MITRSFAERQGAESGGDKDLYNYFINDVELYQKYLLTVIYFGEISHQMIYDLMNIV